MTISLFQLQKSGLLTAGADVASRTARKLTWRAGPPRGCDMALRPRGRAAGSPREAQVAQGTNTWHEATRVHVGPRERPCGAPHGRGVGK